MQHSANMNSKDATLAALARVALSFATTATPVKEKNVARDDAECVGDAGQGVAHAGVHDEEEERHHQRRKRTRYDADDGHTRTEESASTQLKPEPGQRVPPSGYAPLAVTAGLGFDPQGHTADTADTGAVTATGCASSMPWVLECLHSGDELVAFAAAKVYRAVFASTPRSPVLASACLDELVVLAASTTASPLVARRALELLNFVACGPRPHQKGPLSAVQAAAGSRVAVQAAAGSQVANTSSSTGCHCDQQGEVLLANQLTEMFAPITARVRQTLAAMSAGMSAGAGTGTGTGTGSSNTGDCAHKTRPPPLQQLQQLQLLEVSAYLRLLLGMCRTSKTQFTGTPSTSSTPAGDAGNIHTRSTGVAGALATFAACVGEFAFLLQVDFHPARHLLLLCTAHAVSAIDTSMHIDSPVGSVATHTTISGGTAELNESSGRLLAACLGLLRAPGFLAKLHGATVLEDVDGHHLKQAQVFATWRAVVDLGLACFTACNVNNQYAARHSTQRCGQEATEAHLTAVFEAAEMWLLGCATEASLQDAFFQVYGEQDDALISAMLQMLDAEEMLQARGAESTNACATASKTCGAASGASGAAGGTGAGDVPEFTAIATNANVAGVRTRDTCGPAQGAWSSLRFCKVFCMCTAAFGSHAVFVRFCAMVGQDHVVLIDFLMSNETQFLAYFTRYTRLVGSQWDRFTSACAAQDTMDGGTVTGLGDLGSGSSIESDADGSDSGGAHAGGDVQETTRDCICGMLVRLLLSLQRLDRAGLFPYNVKPLLRRLQVVDTLYAGLDDESEDAASDESEH